MKNFKRITIDVVQDTIDIQFNDKFCFMPFQKFIEETNCPFDTENLFFVSYEPDRNIFLVERRGGICENGEHLPEFVWIKVNVEAINNFVETYKHEEVIPTLADRIRPMLQGTDWLVIRHKEQLELGITTSLTQENYNKLLIYRSELRTLSNSNISLEDVIWPDDSFLAN